MKHAHAGTGEPVNGREGDERNLELIEDQPRAAIEGEARSPAELFDDLSARIAELDRVAWNLPATPVTLDGASAQLEQDWRLGADERKTHA